MTRAERLAMAAAGLIGTRFRLHGRHPETGIDCVGLVSLSLAAIDIPTHPPSGYGLRNVSIAAWLADGLPSLFQQVTGPVRNREVRSHEVRSHEVRISDVRPGDVLLIKPGPAQHHFMIAESKRSLIHAHAGLKRVVRQGLAPGTEIAAAWRLPD